MRKQQPTPTDGAPRMRNRLIGLAILLLAAHALLGIMADLRLRRALNDITRHNIPTTAAELMRPPVADADNAALVLAEIGRQMTNDPAFYKSLAKAFDKPLPNTNPESWPPEQRIRIEKILAAPACAGIFALIRQAAGKPECRFDMEYEKGPAAELPNLASLRSATRLICAQTILRNPGADTEPTKDLLLAGLRVSRMLMEESGLIYMLAALAFDKMLMESIPATKLPDAAATAIMGELPKHTDPALMIRALDAERIVVGMWIFERMLRTDYHPVISRIFPVLGGRVNRLLLRPLIKMDYAEYLRDSLRLRNDLASADAESPAPAIPRRPWYGLVSREFAPADRRILDIWRKHLALIETTQAALAEQCQTR